MVTRLKLSRPAVVWLAVNERPEGVTVRAFSDMAGAVDNAREAIVMEVNPDAYPARVRHLVDQVEENAVALAAEGSLDETDPVEYAEGFKISVREAGVKRKGS